METEPKLKLCPFCGSEAEYMKKEFSYDDNINWDVRCSNVNCYLVDGADWIFDTKKEASDNWNKRNLIAGEHYDTI